jgi:hypothetical protein
LSPVEGDAADLGRRQNYCMRFGGIDPPLRVSLAREIKLRVTDRPNGARLLGVDAPARCPPLSRNVDALAGEVK